jgi:hypothetical protein
MPANSRTRMPANGPGRAGSESELGFIAFLVASALHVVPVFGFSSKPP